MTIHYVCYPRRFSTVIMDGTNTDIVLDIAHIIRDFARSAGGRFCSAMPLDEDHPTMCVMEAVMTIPVYKILAGIISEKYPGLCVFDLPLAVG